MEKVSVIIPLYNKEKYIRQCLNSVIRQTYQNVEIIVIDDGSTDNSGKIIKREFSEKLRYYRQDNSGVAVARNYGLKISTGEYIIFVDADDYLKPDYIEHLMKYKNYDFVVSGYISEIKNKRIQNKISEVSLQDKSNIMSYVMKKNHFYYFSQPWGKLFQRRILTENTNIVFPNLSFGEDTGFVLLYLNRCSTLFSVEDAGYINVENAGTLSRKRVLDIDRQLRILTSLIESDGILNNSSKRSFWYMRNIKLKLLNERGIFSSFISQCKRIRHGEFYNINILDLKDRKDRVLYFLMKYRLYLMLYIIMKSI